TAKKFLRKIWDSIFGKGTPAEKNLEAAPLLGLPLLRPEGVCEEPLETTLARIARQEYEEMRASEERAETRIIEALQSHPHQDLLVLATNEFHFTNFRRKLGSRPGQVCMV